MPPFLLWGASRRGFPSHPSLSLLAGGAQDHRERSGASSEESGTPHRLEGPVVAHRGDKRGEASGARDAAHVGRIYGDPPPTLRSCGCTIYMARFFSQRIFPHTV